MGDVYDDVRIDGVGMDMENQYGIDVYSVDVSPLQDSLQKITTPPRYQYGTKVPRSEYQNNETHML